MLLIARMAGESSFLVTGRLKMESVWISLIFGLYFSSISSAQDVNLTFLTSVRRFNANMTIDYYFCCNVVGRFIQWEYNKEPLSGFLSGDVGRVLVDERINYTYTATLLSSQPRDDSQAKLDSIVVISIANNMNPQDITITCSSNRGVKSITSEALVSTAKNSNDEAEEIQLDYVVSGHVVSTYSTTHIFTCAVKNPPQFIEVTGPALGFSIFDDVGQARTIFSDDRNTALVQGILITRENSQALTLIFVVADADVMVTCYDRENRASLEAKESPVMIPYQTAGATTQLTEFSVKYTENTTSFTSPFSVLEVETKNWLATVVAVCVLPIVLILITILVIAVAIVFIKFRQWQRTYVIRKSSSEQYRNEQDCMQFSSLYNKKHQSNPSPPVIMDEMSKLPISQCTDESPYMYRHPFLIRYNKTDQSSVREKMGSNCHKSCRNTMLNCDSTNSTEKMDQFDTTKNLSVASKCNAINRDKCSCVKFECAKMLIYPTFQTTDEN